LASWIVDFEHVKFGSTWEFFIHNNIPLLVTRCVVDACSAPHTPGVRSNAHVDAYVEFV
jgi:hypothetical protein